MNPRSLSFRLSIWYAVTCGIICLALGAFSYFWLSKYMTSRLKERLERKTEQIVALWQLHWQETGEQKAIHDIKVSCAPEHNDLFIRIEKAGGKILYVSGKPVEANFFPEKIPFMPMPKGTQLVWRLPAQNMLIASQIFSSESGYIVEVGASLDPIDRILWDYLMMLSIGVSFALVVAIAGGVVLAKKSLRPVHKIVNAAQEMSWHNLKNRLPIAHTGDELEHLSVVLNQMLARLEEAFQHSQRFCALASHELRTPLTIILGELEGVLRSPRLENEEREKIGSVFEEAERLAKIVGGLFAITRLEAGEAKSESVPFNLSSLVINTAEQMSLLAEEKNLTVRCEGDLTDEVVGDKSRLKQVVVNLLDNAIKYSPPGKEIVLRTRMENGSGFFEVIDSGYGIPDSDLPHIFESFYRSDDERTQKVDGTGLGLSIAKFICTAHGGSIDAINRPEGGCILRVCLPLKPIIL